MMGCTVLFYEGKQTTTEGPYNSRIAVPEKGGCTPYFVLYSVLRTIRMNYVLC